MTMALRGMTLWRMRLSAILCVGATYLSTGCASTIDLSAVQKYSQATADAGSAFEAIARDFQASCERRREAILLLPQYHSSVLLRHTQIELAPGYAGPLANPEPTVPPPPISDDRGEGGACKNAGAVSAEWSSHNATLLAYVHELGAIAAVDAVPSIAPSPLESPLVAANVLSADQFGSFSKLATDISQFVIAGEQRELIARLTVATNDSVVSAVESLKLVDAAYASELHAEYGQVEGGYEDLIGQELDARRKAQPAEQFLLDSDISQQREVEQVSLTALNQRRTASVAYAAVLDGIATTHRELFAAATRKAKAADYIGIFQSTVIPLYEDVQSLKQAVK